MLFNIHPSWQKIIDSALNELNGEYLEFLKNDDSFFPNRDNFLNAFKTLPLNKTKYILFGQDPYPRVESATGYAFIDGKVKSIFSPTGLSKEVNRATSLRNFIKMLLVCERKLTNDFSQEKISKIDKKEYIDSIDDLRVNFEKNGILLLNTALIFTKKEESKKHIKEFKNFTLQLLKELQGRDIKLILFGNSAKDLMKFELLQNFEAVKVPHPYNHSFINNNEVVEFFREMRLLQDIDE